MKTFKSFQEFVDEVNKNGDLANQLQTDPAGTVQKIKIKDKWVYRMAIWFLGIITLIIIVGALWYPENWDNYPEFLIAIASTSIGAIAGLISQSI